MNERLKSSHHVACGGITRPRHRVSPALPLLALTQAACLCGFDDRVVSMLSVPSLIDCWHVRDLPRFRRVRTYRYCRY